VLSADQRDEIEALARRFGEPRRVDATLRGDFFDPIHRRDRVGEVCMVIRRPNGKLLLAIKTFYPRGAHRLPTGGIGIGESILDALRRETSEETGLETTVRRFLASIAYRSGPGAAEPVFRTFAFLLDETGGTLGARDESERIEEFVEIDPRELRAVADRLERVTSEPSKEIGGDWADWGRFRAVVHRVVWEVLSDERSTREGRTDQS
jgi:ADP-ribose pyrophosphatase YjhB (NUDIX family)